MKEQQQHIFGGQTKSKLAGGNAKPRKYSSHKWSFNGAFASQKHHCKPPILQDQRTDDKKQRLFPPKKPERKQNLPSAPDAPRNTTSYIIRAKNSGGIAPCINTPPTPSAPASVDLITSPPYKEDVVEQANQEWGVDSYGSMKGLLRVRHMNQQNDDLEPNLEKCVQVFEKKHEQSLDLDISRFEMVYPANNEIGPQSLEVRITDQDNQIAYLEESNSSLKERVFYMEQELNNLKRRMQVLEVANAFRVREICPGEASFA